MEWWARGLSGRPQDYKLIGEGGERHSLYLTLLGRV